jgi:hypothetical protein
MRPLRSSIVLALLVMLASSASAATVRPDPWRGHLSVGYGRLWSDEYSPGGSLSVAGGVDYQVAPRWRIGPVVGVALLGTTDVVRGSIAAGLDYSLLDVALQAHWLPASGPVTRVSFGPGLAAARTGLQVGGGGAGFLDLAVDEVKPEIAVDISALPRRQTIVAVGLEAGFRYVPVERTDWVLGTLRFTIHY